jgi:hypothetical protein
MKLFFKTICLLILITPFSTITAQFTFDSSTPAAISNNIALNATIVLNFSAAVKSSSITAINIRIRGKNTGIIAGVYSGGTTTQVTFNPTDNFVAGEVITVTITSGVQNTSSTSLSNPTSFSFTTKSSLSTFTPSWTATDISTSADGAISVFAADLDNDGDLDIVSAHLANFTEFAWYENTNGDGSAWTTRVIATSSQGARSVFAADLDNDGDLDLVLASIVDQKIAWFENTNGDASTWTAANISTSGASPYSVFAADLDNDGDLDLVSGFYTNDTIVWFENTNGDASAWTAADIATSADGAHSIFVADLDNDGDLDIVSASNNDDTIAWYKNTNGDASAWIATDINTSADGARDVFVADLDNDGDLDIVSASANDDTIAWYENTNGDASAWTARDIATSADGARSVFVADLDNDGDLDIVSASALDDTIAWYENTNGDAATWTARDIATSADNVMSIFVADLDNDGDLDIVSASADDDTIAWYQNSNNTIWTGTTNSVFDTSTNWSNSVPRADSEVTIPASLTNYPTAANAVTVKSVTLASGASLIASNTFSGAITYNRNLTTTNWYLASSPVVGETYDNAYVTANGIASGAGNNRAIATYVTNGDSWDYMQVGESTTFTSGTGYSVKRSAIGDISFTGTMKVDNTSIALTTAGDGYNLIGNPYPSYINSGSILPNSTAALATQTIWVWNQTTPGYDTKVTAQAFKIAPGQGFFVKSNGNAGNLLIDEDDQSHQSSDTFQRPSAKSEILLTLSDVSDNSKNREAQIYYIEGTTTGFDNGYDGEMFGGVANEFAIYTHLLSDSEGQDFTIQSLPNNKYKNMIVPVGINAVSGTAITITAAAENLPAEMNIYLEDKDNDSFTLLDVDANFSIKLENDLSGIGRFYLHTATTVLSDNDFATSNNISIYSSSKENLRIIGIQNGKAKLQLYNVLGKEILRTSFEGAGANDISLPTLNNGVYIVKIITENGTSNKKIIIK